MRLTQPIGDFRNGCKPEKCTRVFVGVATQLPNKDHKLVELLKSGSHDSCCESEFSWVFHKFFAHFKEMSDKPDRKNIIVIPPTKEGKPNQMLWVAEELKKQFGIECLEILSQDYEGLKKHRELEPRRNQLDLVFPSWKWSDPAEKIISGISDNKKFNFIFIDDICTAGLTAYYVLKKLKESKNLIETKIWNDSSTFEENFYLVAFAKIKEKKDDRGEYFAQIPDLYESDESL